MKRHEVDAARIADLERENATLKAGLQTAKPVIERASETLSDAEAELQRLNANIVDLTTHARRLEEANERLKLQAEAVRDYQLQTIATPVLATLVGNLWDPRSEIPVGGSELRHAAELAINAAQNLLNAIAERATTDEG